MLKSFSIENYRCYSDKVTFEFDSNIGMIFGSNASGKTNALRAFEDTLNCIKNRQGLENDQKIPLYRAHDREKNTSIILVFKDDTERLLQYELEVNGHSVINEKFFKQGTDEVLFSSKLSDGKRQIEINNNVLSKTMRTHINELFHKLLLPNNTLASFLFTTNLGVEHSCIKTLFDFIEETRVFYTTSKEFKELIEDDLLKHIEDDNGMKKQIVKYAKYADPTINNLTLNNNRQIVCHHNDGREGLLNKNESLGTVKVIHMSSIIARMQKKRNFICVFDEIDVHFHPVILSLWLKDINNICNTSQIIFTAHNPLIVDYLQQWKTITTIDNINLLYRNEEQKIQKTTVKEFVNSKGLKIDDIFSLLLFKYWLEYIPHLEDTLWKH